MTDDVLSRAAAGMSRVSVPEEVRDAARFQLERWWNGKVFAEYRDAIQALVDGERWDELTDAFRQVLPFGTGGRRGPVGVGPNRMNPWTVGTSVQGHADWLKGVSSARLAPVQTGRNKPKVVVAYDVRRFDDQKKLYNDVQSPVRHLTSRALAELSAQIYAANGVEVHLLERGSTAWVSTPELSFTIRELGADGGINLSASHNPPDDNGIKVYDNFGGQLAPPEDDALLKVVAEKEQAETISWEDAVASGLVRWLPPELHQRYVSVVADVAPVGPRAIGLLYTPLHGTGAVGEVLVAAGFPCRLHTAQASPDGAFPTVPGGVANPEVPEVMANALAATTPDDVLVFGTDPDADRIGAEVRHQERWVHLTGNEIAALVVAAALAEAPTDPRQPLVIITEVTSTLVSRIAREGGAAVVDDLLVGFKYVAAGLRLLEEKGRWRDIVASEVRFVAGAEESHGVLVTDRIRDKDAAGGAVLLAALAAAERVRGGRTLVDVLAGLRATHGEIRNDQVSLKYEGATGPERLASLLDELRSDPPPLIAGRQVKAAFDHRDESGRFGPFLSDSDRAARNVLVYHLASGPSDEGARVILRPSGTEPKLKVYIEVIGERGLDDAGREKVARSMGEIAIAVRTWLA